MKLMIKRERESPIMKEIENGGPKCGSLLATDQASYTVRLLEQAMIAVYSTCNIK